MTTPTNLELLAAPRPLIPFGADLNGAPAYLERRNILTAGATGTGKTTTLRHVAAVAAAQNDLLYVIDIDTDGAYTFTKKHAHGLAYTWDDAARQLEIIADHARRRSDLAHKHHVNEFERIPAYNRPERIILIVDKLDQILHTHTSDGSYEGARLAEVQTRVRLLIRELWAVGTDHGIIVAAAVENDTLVDALTTPDSDHTTFTLTGEPGTGRLTTANSTGNGFNTRLVTVPVTSD